jgi:phenylacetic acid degradation operon negative regulatory protein
MRALEAGTEQIFTFATRTPVWDGQWTLVAFSVPEDQRAVRTSLRTRLGWRGFAAVFDAVWAAPGDREDDAVALLAECGVRTATVVVGRASPLAPAGNPISAWNLDELRGRYEEFLVRFAPLQAAVAAGALSPAQALRARTAVIDVWREFPGVDPELPVELLPARWPQRDARELFGELYDTLAEPATSRVRAIVAAVSPELAELVSHHTTADALDLLPTHSR